MLHFCPVLRQKPPGRWDFTFSSRRHESVFTISGYTIISPRGKVKALPLPPPERMIERMEKENKWEYDYSSLYNTSSDHGGAGYANVGSSGNNAANQYDVSGAGGSQPPRRPDDKLLPDPGLHPKKRRRFSAGRVLRTVVSLVLAAAVGFAGGYAGSMVGNNHKLVIQAADRTEQLNDALASSTSTAGDDLDTAQVAALVTPSVVPITTEA